MTAPEPNPTNNQPCAPQNVADRPLNICIVSPEFIGPTQGGSGMAYTAMAQALSAAGHHVTCLFIGTKDPSSKTWERWVEKYKQDTLMLVALPQINASELVAPSHLIKSYEVYHWLKRNDRFDIIHFPDRQGPGYHTVTAKHHKLGFHHTTICIGLHSMAAWLKAADPEEASNPTDVDTDFIERRAVALADAVVSPSQYMLNWISNQQWEIPRQRFVQPTILSRSTCPPKQPAAYRLRQINELVYFGTLEPRKGLVLFCDALDSIPPAVAGKIKSVLFIGREAMVDGIPAQIYLQKRAQKWPFAIGVVTSQDEPEVMHYLRQENRLTVMPSLFEKSPYRVLECLEAGVAFIASDIGGISELIDPADASKVCFKPETDVLRAVLCAALTEGIQPARAVLDARANEQAWVNLHETSLFRRCPPVLSSVQQAPAPSDWPPSALATDAARAAIEALSIDPTNAIALKTLARIHLNAGLHEAAQEACQVVLEHDATDAEALQLNEEAAILAAKLSENILDIKSIPHPDPVAARL